MHSFLIVSKTEDAFDKEVQKIAGSNNLKIIEFPVQKIEDARDLKSFLSLSLSQKTLIVIKSFSGASEECANALLKSLEEPQENVTFAIHAKSEEFILPTIRSRCTIVRAKTNIVNNSHNEIGEFLEKDVMEMSNEIGIYKKREEAISFTEKVIEYYSEKISHPNSDSNILNRTKAALQLKKSLERNGNINLHTLRFLTRIR